MNITSSAFQNNGSIPSKYTCDGENILPPLAVSDIPEETKSLVLIVDDPDAPMGTWVHWVVYNIDPKTTEIPEGSVPLNAVQGENTAGNVEFHGPCPPNGTHRYFFKLYALDTVLELLKRGTKEEVKETIKKHVLDKAELIGLYTRKKN